MKAIWRASTVLFVLILVSQADAELRKFDMHYDSQNPLRGVTGIWVDIEDIDPVIEADGLRKEQIRKDVESKLKTAGFNILTEKEYADAVGLSQMSIRVNLAKTAAAPAYYHYGIRVSVNQGLYLQKTVDLNNHFSKINIPFWVKDLTGSTVRISSIRDSINSTIDKLILDYIAAKLEL